jgi:hypothetical protein
MVRSENIDWFWGYYQCNDYLEKIGPFIVFKKNNKLKIWQKKKKKKKTKKKILKISYR